MPAALAPLLAGLLAIGQSDIPASPLPFEPHRFGTPPVVDGQVTPAEWSSVAPVPLVNLYPAFESPLTERTEIRVGYDATHFYASIRAWDSEPGRIRATTLYRDRWESDDEFVVILDTFADGQNGAMFLVTPAGVRVDNELTHDAQPGRGEWLNRNWDVPWDAAAVMLEDGWSAELRVPFSSLRFNIVDGLVRMRLKTYRYLPRKGENQMFPATRPDDGAAPHFRPSIGQPIAFEGIHAAVPIYVQPYVAATSDARGGGGRDVNAGFDAKFLPSRSTSVDLTVNTDFAQVEVDQLQVNLTRFAIRFPERRPFFLERAGLFALGLGSNDTLFHSRRVGLTDQGLPLPVLGGARVVSRAAGWDFGALNVHVGAGDDGGGNENAAVLRAQRTSRAGHAFGVTATSLAGRGETDVAAAIDGSIAIGRDRMTGVWATSSGRGPASERSRGMWRWQRGAEEGWSYNGEYRFTGREFDPTLGFLRLADAHEVEGLVRQTVRPAESSFARRYGWSIQTSSRWRRADDVREDTRATVEANVDTHGGVFGNLRVTAAEEDVPAPFTIAPGTTIRPGRYRAVTARLFVASPPRPMQVFASVEGGGFFGGRRVGWRVEPVWTPSRHLQMWAIADTSVLTGLPGGDRSLHLVIAGTRAAFTTRLFADLVVQRATGQTPVGQVRFRWNLAEGHDFWFVNERGRAADGRPSHSVSIKYTRLLTIARTTPS